ncbi:peptidase M28 [Capnocytophaga stomatis]|uniref:M20/M25/M40 family metallo-hydrolase n=1 Tax=Capnocytophaga stomatis TaxID=1848904 RepID=UPI00195190D7|nr:M20/M25/M40 family metallo-hydrolase [Capnocytophaga stomatis]GIJ96263.1 peptidase M28 [Capnocytophaga stomatis]GIM49281.1 peptidase M28 [Capnocytophaga stomatis]
MKNKFIIILTCIFCSIFGIINAQNDKDSIFLRNIYNQALTEGKAYDWLHQICYNVGARLSGSYGEKKMIRFLETELNNLNTKVTLQPVMVPHWARGISEYAYIETSKGKTTTVPILALGGSVATPASGIKAQVVEFKSLEELEKADINKVVGKIAFINGALPNDFIDVSDAYGVRGAQRYSGARIAVNKGAIAVIVRSLTHKLDNSPHTGVMSYEDLPRSRHIPAAAISTNGADMLSSLLSLNPDLNFFFKQSCKIFNDVQSNNVIAEIKGSEFPNEIISFGAHLDSWDVGQGAHDDGAGVAQCLEVIRIFKALNYKPKRTIRIVFFANEENGAKGAIKYAEESKNKKENQIFALESDAGGFTPLGFSLQGNEKKIQKIQSWKNLFKPYQVYYFEKGFPGLDINFLQTEDNVLAGLYVNSQRYFDYHHSENDVFEAVNKRELELGAAAMASLIYLVDKYGL